MELGTILSVAQTLFSALQCSELRDICSFLGYQSELDNLSHTVETVKAVLLDAESKGDELTHQAQRFIEDLKDAIYDADDLLDEFVTLSERKHKKLIKEGASKVSDKVRGLFSRIKDLPTAYNMSKEVKKIRKKLDAIADNHNKFGFKLDSKPIRKRKEETCSYVYAQDIIGRDGDKEKIVGMLLDPNVHKDVSFLTIVGMGGLGKTTLAQLVYNDERIARKFPTRLWACVGDEDTIHVNVKRVLAKILESTTRKKHDESSLETLQCDLREELGKNKYLLILDDVWNENRDEWLGLENFLKGGPSGSWVVVTTRSSNTAAIVGDGSSYDLKGLSVEDSWRLFERVAFGQEGGQANPPVLVGIGQMVVKKCANVPLAIRVAGSLLYGQDEDKWLSFEKNGLTAINPEKNGILPILKFSYHHLEYPLKSCFSYCALFPKDYRIRKEMLISLWMAQGYVVPLDEGQSIEDAGEEYFSILLRRCFFQDVDEEEVGDVSCKIHDLMHDVAQQVARKEVCIVDHSTSDLGKRILHLNVVDSMGIKGSLLKKKTVRTLLYGSESKSMEFVEDTPLENWMSLRTLGLPCLELRSLPDTIGKLVHLRYLDLSDNLQLEKLPKLFTKLHNLETLILKDCSKLRELPHDIGKLVKLSCLDIIGCDELAHMPASIGKLSCLHRLSMFVVNLSNSSCCLNELEGLRALTQLEGFMHMKIKDSEDAKYVKEDRSGGGYLINKPHLNKIGFIFEGDGEQDYHEALMENMLPHPKLTDLVIKGYKGGRMPGWGREENLVTYLPNLVMIRLISCDGLKYLPGLGKLRHLGYLLLEGLSSLEYMEESRNSSQVGGTGAASGSRGIVEESLFFPSLKKLVLENLPRLKGWWRDQEGEGEGDESNDVGLHRYPSPCFPHLSDLIIRGCQELTLIPSLPSMEKLILERVNERLRTRGAGVIEKEGMGEQGGGGGGPTYSPCIVTTDNVGFLKSVLSMKSLQCLTELKIHGDHKVERLEDNQEVWRSCCSSSLRSLDILSCGNLKSVVKGGLEHLIALEELQITQCSNLILTQEGEEDASFPSASLCLSLRSLELANLPKLVNLPEWMRYLTSLQSLYILWCTELKSLPEWMPHLTSLTSLKIACCSEEFKQRCSPSPPGQDWPYIQHIPDIRISTSYIIPNRYEGRPPP